MQNPPQMELFKGNLIIYYKSLWFKYGNLNFSPLEYGEFGRFFSKINLICKKKLVFFSIVHGEISPQKKPNLE
jgi:hypothetical protein